MENENTILENEMETQKTIWRAWTTRTKNCSGFAENGKFSAHFDSNQIYIRELDAEEIESADEKVTHAISIPKQLIGGAVQTGGELILCKSLGHAEHIMQSGEPVKRAKEMGWFDSAQAAAAAAYKELLRRGGVK